MKYIIKYITKRDEDNPEFNGKIFTSKRIGIGYINKNTLRRHRYQDRFTEETHKTESGIKAITKRDEDNPEFNGKIFTSKKIGIDYINKNTLRRHRYQANIVTGKQIGRAHV